MPFRRTDEDREHALERTTKLGRLRFIIAARGLIHVSALCQLKLYRLYVICGPAVVARSIATLKTGIHNSLKGAVFSNFDDVAGNTGITAAPTPGTNI